ncbi:hypothetical protein SAMN04487909_1688 [Aneurinibacillus migulanus]|uniref:Uncharacterized protein n=1 Tax=Aneurinibacillus migulanus TaxID=47500 RepID=A0A1G9CRF0_ANEMI|nr:hypothetical protein AMI01nite_59130 [Aneurinibacillus migulanus]SDK54283.1 hypothetical protein SAMN04487909_1688 [Aneurinibacillus migulanus]
MSLKDWILNNIDDFNTKVKSEEDLKIKVVIPYFEGTWLFRRRF